MKSIGFRIGIIILFVILLAFPTHTFHGASSGLLLWYSILLPTLLPFMIISNLMIKTQAYILFTKPLSPIIKFIFHTSDVGAFAVIIGFLCGYPMGAKTINDLYIEGQISRIEAQYLLSFCNNSSPMFIISFFVYQILKDFTLLVPICISIYGSAILMSFFTRKIYHSFISNTSNVTAKNTTHFSFQMLDDTLINSIILIMKIGGYVMLFSIFISISTALNNHLYTILNTNLTWLHTCFEYLIPLSEITNGLELYSRFQCKTFYYSPMIFLVSMGGFCAIGQTKCVITAKELKISHYFTQKIITAILAVIIWKTIIIFF